MENKIKCQECNMEKTDDTDWGISKDDCTHSELEKCPYCGASLCRECFEKILSEVK